MPPPKYLAIARIQSLEEESNSACDEGIKHPGKIARGNIFEKIVDKPNMGSTYPPSLCNRQSLLRYASKYEPELSSGPDSSEKPEALVDCMDIDLAEQPRELSRWDEFHKTNAVAGGIEKRDEVTMNEVPGQSATGAEDSWVTAEACKSDGGLQASMGAAGLVGCDDLADSSNSTEPLFSRSGPFQTRSLEEEAFEPIEYAFESQVSATCGSIGSGFPDHREFEIRLAENMLGIGTHFDHALDRCIWRAEDMIAEATRTLVSQAETSEVDLFFFEEGEPTLKPAGILAETRTAARGEGASDGPSKINASPKDSISSSGASDTLKAGRGSVYQRIARPKLALPKSVAAGQSRLPRPTTGF